jgi:uncharacterized glyoxalase superfamily protein PhnB
MSDTSSSNERRERTQPESFRARTLTASFTVNDLTKSKAWYCDVLGFTVDKEHERGGQIRAYSLKAGEVRILIGQDDGAKGMDRQKGLGTSIMISTAQDVDAIAARIKERGGVLAAEPATMPWGARAFRIEDPDGFKIAISSV